MIKYILGAVVLVVLAILGFAATRPDSFRYERSGVINASADKIFAYLRDFKKGSEWTPYERIDLNMKKSYSGPQSGVGAVMEFDGNNEIGAGRLEILKETPNEFVQIKLSMTRPIQALNTVEYKLTPEGNATRFTWTMYGEANFFSKVIGLFINCEKMVGDQFEQGIKNLKQVLESK